MDNDFVHAVLQNDTVYLRKSPEPGDRTSNRTFKIKVFIINNQQFFVVCRILFGRDFRSTKITNF